MEPFEMFKNLMVMAAADQKFTEEEIAFLSMRSSRWGLTDAQFDEALQYVASGRQEMTYPESREQRLMLLRNLLQIMAADGELAPVEKRLFAEASARMEITGEELDRLIDELV